VALNNINLDDKRWALIAQEARLLIPSFAPEWTDHNVHDPGITFLELFAWLEEIQRYRLNRTSAQLRNRFLALAGVPPEASKPATALVEFTTTSTSTEPYITVPAQTPITVTGHDDVPFRTVRDSYLLPGSISAVETIAGGRELDRTKAECDGTGHFDAFGLAPKAGDALVITFKPWISAPQISLAFRVFDLDLPPLRTGPQPVPSVTLRWEYSADSKNWLPLTLVRDTTAALTLSGFVVLSDPKDRIVQIRATVASGTYEIPPRLSTIRLNVLEAEQVGRAAPTLQTPSGLPDQEQTLAPTPMAGAQPVIQVGPEGHEKDWTLVKDFDSSDPKSEHYTFDRATGIVRFGNGLNGTIPDAKFRIAVKEFAYTLGDAGNLTQGLTWKLSEPTEASVWSGKNPQPASGGSDAETLEDTELRARGEFRKSFRGVTAPDLEDLAKKTPNIRVGRAKILPGSNPDLPCASTLDDVSIVILPAARPDLDTELPSDGFRETVRRSLESTRLVASRLHVIAPEFVPLHLAATITLKPRAAAAIVQRDIESALRAFLSREIWLFGRDIFPSEIHQQLIAVAGVAFASKVRINGKNSKLSLSPIQLPRVDEISLEILEARDA
jgi:hypothetical protein